VWVCLCVYVSVFLRVCVRVSVLESDAAEMDCQVCNVCVGMSVCLCVNVSVCLCVREYVGERCRRDGLPGV